MCNIFRMKRFNNIFSHLHIGCFDVTDVVEQLKELMLDRLGPHPFIQKSIHSQNRFERTTAQARALVPTTRAFSTHLLRHAVSR